MAAGNHSLPKQLAFAWLAVLACLCGGCPAPAPPEPVKLQTAGVRPAVEYSELKAVLKSGLDKSGRLLPRRFRPKQSPTDPCPALLTPLRAQLERLAVTGPSATPALFPSSEARLAYGYNARAAWAIWLAADADFAKDIPPARLEEREFPLDGGHSSLRAIDAAIEREGGWQAVAAAPCVRLRRAALPREPFQAATIRQDVRRRLSDLLDDAERTPIDVAGRRVLLPPVLWQHRDEILRQHRRAYGVPEATLLSALLPLAEGAALRRLQNAVGDGCGQAPPSNALAVAEE